MGHAPISLGIRLVEGVAVRVAFRLLAAVAVSVGMFTGTAAAQTGTAFRMDEVFTSQTKSTNSDFAFWGKHAFMGYYTGATGFPPGTGSRGGVQIFDISTPEAPRLVRDFACDG